VANGRRVTVRDVDEQFSGLAGTAHYQFLRQENGSWVMRIVPDRGGPSDGEREELRGRLEHLTDNQVEIQSVDLLLPEKSGKFRLVYPGA
jgi:hypothetical protein